MKGEIQRQVALLKLINMQKELEYVEGDLIPSVGKAKSCIMIEEIYYAIEKVKDKIKKMGGEKQKQ